MSVDLDRRQRTEQGAIAGTVGWIPRIESFLIGRLAEFTGPRLTDCAGTGNRRWCAGLSGGGQQGITANALPKVLGSQDSPCTSSAA